MGHYRHVGGLSAGGPRRGLSVSDSSARLLFRRCFRARARRVPVDLCRRRRGDAPHGKRQLPADGRYDVPDLSRRLAYLPSQSRNGMERLLDRIPGTGDRRPRGRRLFQRKVAGVPDRTFSAGRRCLPRGAGRSRQGRPLLPAGALRGGVSADGAGAEPRRRESLPTGSCATRSPGPN